jgi:hypothetical protein
MFRMLSMALQCYYPSYFFFSQKVVEFMFGPRLRVQVRTWLNGPILRISACQCSVYIAPSLFLLSLSRRYKA